MTGRGTNGPKFHDDLLQIECPACEQTILTDSGRTIDAAVAAHDTTCPGEPAWAPTRPSRIDCGDCGRHLGDVGHDPASAQLQRDRLFALHTCAPKPTRTPRRPQMTTTTTPPPPGDTALLGRLDPRVSKACPDPRQLLTHPSKRIARQAAKVLAEEAKLVAAWKEDGTNARIREAIAAKEAEIKALRAQLRVPGPKPKAS